MGKEYDFRLPSERLSQRYSQWGKDDLIEEHVFRTSHLARFYDLTGLQGRPLFPIETSTDFADRPPKPSTFIRYAMNDDFNPRRFDHFMIFGRTDLNSATRSGEAARSTDEYGTTRTTH